MKKGMRAKRKWITALLCAGLLGGLTPVMAAESLELHMEGSRVEDQNLIIYVNDSLERSEEETNPENYQITLGDSTLPCMSAAYFGDTEEVTAYVYLVDVSGSISSSKLEQMKAYLKEVTAQIGEDDLVCLITLGNEMNIGGFISGQENINTQIDEIERLTDDTNLYYGIVESLKLLDSGGHGANKEALLILSDGQDDQTTGITREEVNAFLEKTNIPVYTVAMLDENSSKQQQEFAKILGSFARLSAGGIHTTLGAEDISAKESAARMVNSLEDGLVLTADLSGYEPETGQAYLQVELSVDGVGTASDGYYISEKDLSAAIQSGEQEVKESDGEDDSEAEDAVPEDGSADGDEASDGENASGDDANRSQEGEGGFSIGLIVGIIVAAVVLVLLVVLFKKKKGNRQEEPEDTENEIREIPDDQEQGSDDGISEVSDGESGEQADAKPKQESEEAAEDIVAKLERNLSAEQTNREETIVYLTRIGMAEHRTYEIRIQGEVTIGRAPDKATYAFPEDRHMSGLHCAIAYVNRRLILRDLGSKNGTQVNGVPITAPYALNCDDVIHIGKTELRIHW